MLQTETFLKLPGLELRLETDRPELFPVIQDIFSAGSPLMFDHAKTGDRREITLSAVSSPNMSANAYSELTVDGEFVYTTFTQAALVNYMETAVTDKLARHFTEYLLFHSGALALNGKGILLPGASGNGKSTTTTCLAMSGFAYYSDEMAVCSPDGLALFPFPKVPSLKTGGCEVVKANFADEAKAVYTPSANGVTYFNPRNLPSEEEATNGVPIEYVLLPHRPEAGETLLEPVKKSEALRVFIEESLDLELKYAAGFKSIMAMLEGADCYELRLGDVCRTSATMGQNR